MKLVADSLGSIPDESIPSIVGWISELSDLTNLENNRDCFLLSKLSKLFRMESINKIVHHVASYRELCLLVECIYHRNMALVTLNEKTHHYKNLPDFYSDYGIIGGFWNYDSVFKQVERVFEDNDDTRYDFDTDNE